MKSLHQFVYLLFAATLLMLGACSAESSESYKEGVHYKIAKPLGKAGKPEVMEFFSYGCPHCFQTEPAIQQFHQASADTITLKRVAVVGFRPQWDLLAKAYYTAEILGISEQMHMPLFRRVHVDNKMLDNDQQIVEFLTQFGVSADTVSGTLNSFAVNTLMKSAEQQQRAYRISGVPAFIVNEKFFTDVQMAGGAEKLSALLNYLSTK